MWSGPKEAGAGVVATGEGRVLQSDTSLWGPAASLGLVAPAPSVPPTRELLFLCPLVLWASLLPALTLQCSSLSLGRRVSHPTLRGWEQGPWSPAMCSRALPGAGPMPAPPSLGSRRSRTRTQTL